ncbi:uncharacterized protein LOC122253631 [Penaeus japonicus]|uniref:uncharacterized protein LOC122253631 n=1 Tax=Penaeus japonicus TaxID=27405 RepID=UPI001C71102E|nr:uncharacterized protein LOC122253631 [Penaeus japonicus]
MEGPVDVEEVNLQKRHRSRNFTKYEKEVFYTVFSQYASIINDKATSTDTIRDAWDRLVVEYNSQHNVYPRTRRQLQVLWRDEKFRAKKKVRKEQESGGRGCAEQTSPVNLASLAVASRSVSNEGRTHSGNLLTPLLTVIKREREAYAAGETTILPLTQYHSEDDQISSESPANPERANDESCGNRAFVASHSPNSYKNNEVEDDPMSPLPVETQLHSVSNSPVDTPTHEDGRSCSPEDTVYWEPDDRRRTRIRDASLLESDYSPEPYASEKRAREYHRLRMAQLRDEGAARLRVLEAELALHSQERHMRQQEHQIRMEILMEKLKRIREGAHVKD